jgi:hypothetical protein
MLGNRARISKPVKITAGGILLCHQQKKNIHPAHISLHDVMRKIWNDLAGFSPEFRENYYFRLILNEWNGWNHWNWLLRE